MGKSDADKLNFWTKDEYDCFISGIDRESKYYVIFEILFWTGCREGEMLALTKEDVDFENNQISITKTYYRTERRDYYYNAENGTYGNIQRKTEARYVEVLKFWHFVRIGSINGIDHFDRHKTIHNKIPVSVVLDLGVGKTNKNKYTIT